MLHETLKERLNWVLIITNGSRNKELYERLAELAKSINLIMHISIHTDHVKLPHILELIENLSADVNITFSLMFNPDKREFVHEIYDTLFEYRKKYWFNLNVVTLRDGDIVDTRYTPEDFAWQKETVTQFNELVKSVSAQFPKRKKSAHSNPVIHTMEDNGEIKNVNMGNRFVELSGGGFKYKGMYCIAHAALIRILENGRCKGMVCGDDKTICNIYDKNSFRAVRDKLIHAVRCTNRVCGCSSNDPIPKFVSEAEAKKFVEFAKKRQTELFAEYEAAQSQLSQIDLLTEEIQYEIIIPSVFSLGDYK